MKFLFRFFSLTIITLITTTSCVSNYVTANNSSYKYLSANELLAHNVKGPNVSKVSEKTLLTESLEDMNKYVLTKVAYDLITEAKTYLGTPYRYGGTTRNGIDCSSFVQHVFDASNISLPRTSVEQSKSGEIITRSELKKGDLIFFAHSPKSRVSHVGIVERVSETGEVFFIHASSSQGVTITSLESAYWSKRYRTAKRLLPSNMIDNMEGENVDIPVIASS